MAPRARGMLGAAPEDVVDGLSQPVEIVEDGDAAQGTHHLLEFLGGLVALEPMLICLGQVI